MKRLLLAPLLLAFVGCSATYEYGYEIKKKSYNKRTGTEIRYLRSENEARGFCRALSQKFSCIHDPETRQYYLSPPDEETVFWRIYY